MELPRLVPIEYGGHLVALISARRIHIVAPWLLGRPAGDPELRFIAYMCLCCSEILGGRLPGPYTNELGEQWAWRALVLGAGNDHVASGHEPSGASPISDQSTDADQHGEGDRPRPRGGQR
jgi:hypothetical protein